MFVRSGRFLLRSRLAAKWIVRGRRRLSTVHRRARAKRSEAFAGKHSPDVPWPVNRRCAVGRGRTPWTAPLSESPTLRYWWGYGPGMANALPPSYADRLFAELDGFEERYVAILGRSGTYYSNPNRRGDTLILVGAADYSWRDSDPELEKDRMALLVELRGWRVRFELLFPAPTPEAAKRHKKAFGHVERWLLRNGGNDLSLRADTAEMVPELRETFDVLRAARAVLGTDDYPVRLVVDTSALVDNPDVAAYTDAVGARYMMHVPPTTLKELDDLKRSGRTEQLRRDADKALRRLKGYRANGDVLAGVRVAGEVSVLFAAAEPRGDGLPGWLDLGVPDDRVAASALLLQSEHPGSWLAVVTSDLALQTKLAAVGLPFIDGARPDDADL